MGGAVSAGEDNDELIDNLVGAEYIKSKNIEAIFRSVDRGHYYEEGFKDTAYRDTAWKHGHIHLSAPCIYSEVMEALELKPGHSFLNIGSGTGYLSTMVGLMIGPSGVNHGIEIFADVVDYAKCKLDQFKEKSAALYKYDFCEPQFVVGNGLDYTDTGSVGQYDRVYVGAGISGEHEVFMCNFLKVGGILVVPFGDQLLQIRRVSTTEWTKRSILPVSFASLMRSGTVIGGQDDHLAGDMKFPDRQPLSLKLMARMTINRLIREQVLEGFPELIDPTRSRRGKKIVSCVRYKRRRRIARRLVAFVAASRGGGASGSSSSEDSNHGHGSEGAADVLSSSASSSGSASNRAREALMEVLGSSSEPDEVSPMIATVSGGGKSGTLIKTSSPGSSASSSSDTGLGESVTSGSNIGSVASSVRGSFDDTTSKVSNHGHDEPSSVKYPPLNAFQIFAVEQEPKLRSDNPDKSSMDIDQQLKRMWRSLNREEQDKYYKLSRESGYGRREEADPVPSGSSAPVDVPSLSSMSSVTSGRRTISSILPNSLSAAISHVIGTDADPVPIPFLPIGGGDPVGHGQEMDTSSGSGSDSSSNGNRTSSESSTEGMDSVRTSTSTEEGLSNVSEGDEGSNGGHVEYSTSSDTENGGTSKDGHDEQKRGSQLDEFGYRFQERIQLLPLPTALKVFLNYERPFDLGCN